MVGKTYEDFLLLGVNYLRKYLNVRGVATSGYSNMELVARAFSASEMNLPIVMSSAQLKESLIKDYDQQLQEYGLRDPLKVLVSDRTNYIYDWPQINLGQFFIKFKNKNFLERLYWTLQRRKSDVYTKRNNIAKKIKPPFPKATHLPGILKYLFLSYTFTYLLILINIVTYLSSYIFFIH